MSFETNNDFEETENDNHYELYHRIYDVVEKYVNKKRLVDVRGEFSKNLHKTIEVIYKRDV